MHCDHCTNNCTSHRAECFNKDECKGWYVFLTTSSCTWHAKGIRAGIKFDDGTYVRYKRGVFYTRANDTKVDGEWYIPSMGLDWQPMERPYVPTWKDKLRKFFLKKDYPKTVDVRPDNDTIVITKYGDDSHYEIVEYASRTWVTMYCFPLKPTQWAYIPKYVMDIVDGIINKKEE